MQSIVLRLSLNPNCDVLNILSFSHQELIRLRNVVENILAMIFTNVIPL